MTSTRFRIGSALAFPQLHCFPEGCGYKQWTGDDLKALMKVILPAIVGQVPPQMIKAISSFMEFCYLVRWSVIDKNDLNKLDYFLAKYHEEHEIFHTEGIRKGFNLPRQHSLMHYQEVITQFGAPNGTCSSITESWHHEAVKDVYCRSNKFNVLPQMLHSNGCIDKLAASGINFGSCGMLKESMWANHVDPPPPPEAVDDDDDGGRIDDQNIMAEVKLAKVPSVSLYFIVCLHNLINNSC
ncbi:hypothetical protein APHAL10511_008380 [Amanita phalloides]|nr:hypothetical protein APHAL10511_008380 [Amanita phalloides]